MGRYSLEWLKPIPLSGLRFVCGYCGADTAPAHGYTTSVAGSDQGIIAICPNCNRPSFLEKTSHQIAMCTPAAKMGKEVGGLPDDVAKLYDEARQCSSAGAHTAAVLTCRKILMHVAVEKGAPANKGFFEYVQFLAEKNYIPSDGKDWIDHIRTKSNEANHEIQVMGVEDAEDLITFTEMLLRLVYEFKNRLAKKSTTTPTPIP